MSWTIVCCAYGEWEIEGSFRTKNAAVEHLQMIQGTDARPTKESSGFYMIGSDAIVKTSDLIVYGYSK